jgi:hypothetical protein
LFDFCTGFGVEEVYLQVVGRCINYVEHVIVVVYRFWERAAKVTTKLGAKIRILTGIGMGREGLSPGCAGIASIAGSWRYRNPIVSSSRESYAPGCKKVKSTITSM